MSDITDALLEGLLEREAEEGATFTWAGKCFPCSAGAETTGKMLGAGGFKVTADMTLVVRTAVFPAGIGLPAEEQTISYKAGPGLDARALRIKNITRWRGVILVLQCVAKDQGA